MTEKIRTIKPHSFEGGGFTVYSGNLCDSKYQRPERSANFIKYLLDENSQLPEILCLQEASVGIAGKLEGYYNKVNFESFAYKNGYENDSGLILASRLHQVGHCESTIFGSGSNYTQIARLAFKGVGLDLVVVNGHRPYRYLDLKKKGINESVVISDYIDKHIKGIGGIIVAKDFNAQPGDESYDIMLAQGYKEALGEGTTYPSQWAIENNHPGLSWLQKPFVKAWLGNGRRIDNILYKGSVALSTVSLVDEGYSMSDHAHLRAEFRNVKVTPIDGDVVQEQTSLAA